MNTSGFQQVLRRVVLVPVVAVLAAALALAWQIHQGTDAVAMIELNDLRLSRAYRIEQLVAEEDSGLRGYQVARSAGLLQRYQSAQAALPAAFAARRSLADTTQQTALINETEALYARWQVAYAAPTLAALAPGSSIQPVSLDPRADLQGRLAMDELRGRLSELNRASASTRDQAVGRWRTLAHRMIAGTIVFAVVLGTLLGLYIRRLTTSMSLAFRRSHDALRSRAQEIFSSEEQLRTTLRSIGDGVITCDSEGLIQNINDVAQQLTGWTEADALQRPLTEVFCVVDERTRKAVEDPVSKVNRLKQIVKVSSDTLLIRKDGQELYIDDNGAPIRDREGKLVGVVLVFRDVTLARNSREALLANEKFAVAGHLAAAIAHEIHNPLDSVSNLLFLMDGFATPAEHQQFLQLAKQEIARVTQISRAMLSLYRISRNAVEINVAETLESILLLLSSRLLALEVNVVQQVPENIHLSGFPAEFRQVCTNLLTNAAEACGPGGEIRLVAHEITAGIDSEGLRRDAGVLLAIEDNGPGMPEPVLDRLFEPFFTTKGADGTGLGLWICKGIITKQGGHIDLTSSIEADDHGTTVEVFFPHTPHVPVSPDAERSEHVEKEQAA